MTYFLCPNGSIQVTLDSGAIMTLPPEDNGSPEWSAYQAWLDEGNTPDPLPEPPPTPDYQAFWDALLVSPVYQLIRSQAITNPAVLVATTECIAAITDAKAGKPNVPAIQACLNNLLTDGNFTALELEEIYRLLTIGNLQDIFVLNTPEP